MSKQLKLGFILAIAFQAFILVWMLISANLPRWFGQEIKVYTRPIDPRSLFRGNYAHLDYPLERISLSKDQALYDKTLRRGEVIYLSLTQDDKGIYIAKTLHLSPPENEIYLQGRVLTAHHAEEYSSLRLRFANINAFFSPKEKALALEQQLRNEAIAVLMVSDSGKAILKTVEASHNKN